MSNGLRLILLLPLAALVAAFLVYPLLILFAASLHPGEAAALSLANYEKLLENPDFRTSLLHSVVLSAAVAAGATGLSLGPAWLLARYDFRGKWLLRAGFALPMSLSGIIVGFLTVIMLGRVGFVPKVAEALTGRAWLAGSAYQLTGLVIAYLYFEIPRGMLTLEGALRRFDPALEAAARSLGASRGQRFRWVVWPLIAPVLASTFAVTFSVSLGSFGVALVVSRRFSVLPLEMFQQFTAALQTPLASAMAVSLVAIALGVNLAVAHSVRRFFPGYA